MGTVKKIGGDYYIEFYARGLLYQQKAGPDKSSAEKMLKEVEDKIHKGEMGIIVRDIELDVFIQTFLGHIQETMPLKTVQRFERAAQHFLRFCQSDVAATCKISQMTPSVMESYRLFLIKKSQEKFGKIKERLIDFTILLVAEMMEYGIKVGYINDNPTLHTKLFSQRKEDALEKKGVPQECLSPLILWIIWTGFTPSEMTALRWSAIDLHEKHVTIVGSKSAGGKSLPRQIPLQKEAIDYLQGLKARKQGDYVFTDPFGNVYTPAQLSRIIDQQLAVCWPEAKMNCLRLRRVFSARIFPQRTTLMRLSRLLGFQDVARAMSYQL